MEIIKKLYQTSTKKLILFSLLVLSLLLSLSLLTGVISNPFSRLVEAEGETEIYYLQDLDAIRNDLTASYILMNDLDFNDDASYDQTDPDWATKKTSWTTGVGWTPLGDSTTNFSGIFNGQDFTISNLFIDDSTEGDKGLFGYSAGTINNLGLVNLNINGNNLVGGIVGSLMEDATIDNSYTTGTISALHCSYAGGLVGEAYEGANIDNSYSTVTISGDDWSSDIGGLVGSLWYAAISNSYFSGSISSIDPDPEMAISDNSGGLVGYSKGSTIINSYSTGSVSGYYQTGGLVGEVYDTIITNSYSTVTVNGLYQAGGFIGYTGADVVIDKCFAAGDIVGEGEVGGFVGVTSNVQISNSYATGDVSEISSDVGWYIGGFVGYSSNTTQINNSYSAGSVTGNPDYDVGGFSGYSEDSESVTNSFWDTQTSSMATSAAGTGKTTAQMKTLSTFSAVPWDIVLMSSFDPLSPNTWYINEGSNYPELSYSFVAPTELVYLQDLDAVRNDLTESYILMNDLDFNEDASYDQTDPDWATKKTAWTTGTGWTPIGNAVTTFTGTLDGQDYTISNLFINNPSGSYQGLFGYNEGTTISNLGLLNVNITGSWMIGGIVGLIDASTIENSYTTGTITLGNAYAGGLVGEADTASLINNSYSTATVSGQQSYLGGLIGKILDGTTVSNSHFSGSVLAIGSSNDNSGGLVGITDTSTITNCYSTGTVEGTYAIGGLVGYNEETTITNSYSTSSVIGIGYSSEIGGFIGKNQNPSGGGTIDSCYATGDVTGDDEVGGFFGESYYGKISNSYSTGAVSEVAGESEDGYYIGGFIGNSSNDEINNCYSVGSVTTYDPDDVGGFVGRFATSSSLTNSFWDTETSGWETSAAGTGKTTSEMKSISTFNDTATVGLDVAWDISLMSNFDPLTPNTWYIEDTTDYPKLSYQYVAPVDPPEDPPEEPGEEDPPAEENTEPIVLTNSATSISTNSAQLNGYLDEVGTYGTPTVFFQYRTVGGNWNNTNGSSKDSVGVYSYLLSNLNPNSTYEFRAGVNYDTSSTNYGSILTFTTTLEVIPKVIITDIGLINNIPNQDTLLYYFTSTKPRIKGISSPRSTVRFETGTQLFSTEADDEGLFEILIDLYEDTFRFEYYAYNSFGSQSPRRELTLVIDTGYLDEDDDDEEEEEIPEEDQEDEEETEEDPSENSPPTVGEENTDPPQTDPEDKEANLVFNVIGDNIKDFVQGAIMTISDLKINPKTANTIGTIGYAAATTTYIVINFITFTGENSASSLQILSSFFIIGGLKKKKKQKYGIVYDSITKEPINMATVRVFNQSGNLITTAVTDIYGIFDLELEDGSYTFQVVSRNHEFPSRAMLGPNDEPYQNVYKGGLINYNSNEVLNISIPMDKVDRGFIEKTVASGRSIILAVLNILFTLLFILGFLLTIVSLVKTPSTLMWILLTLYLISILIWIYLELKQKRSYGTVTTTDGTPLEGMEIGLRELEFDTLFGKRITDEQGRYRFLLPEGKYRLESLDDRYAFIDLDKNSFEVTEGKLYILDEDITVRKIA